MDLNAVISDLQKRVAKAEEAAKELPRLRYLLEGALELRNQYGPSENGSKQGDPRAMEEATKALARGTWANLSRREAIVRLLREEKRPLRPSEITKLLRERGRDEQKSNPISATLAGMKDRGDARQVGNGKWLLKDQELPTDERVGDLLGLDRP
jgi:hypothetical protein